MSWEIAYVLPNILLKQPFEAQFIALVPYSDDRIQKILSNSEQSKKLLDGFIDQSNRKVDPSVIIINQNAPPKVRTIEAISSFRNCIAMAIILRGWADVRPDGSPLNPLFSDFFDFYPVTIGKNGGLVTITPALNSYRYKNAPFVGMAAPHISQLAKGISLTVDDILYQALIKIWERRFVRPGRDSPYSRRLFRSIEMAYHATSTPFKNQSSLHDYGLSISQWISSFEIIFHPSKDPKVNQKIVIKQLGSYKWKSKYLLHRRYKVKYSNKDKEYVNLAQRLYKNLYDARNEFLHGNSVNKKTLYPFGNKKLQPLYIYAPILYRTALYIYLAPNIKQKKHSICWQISERIKESVYDECLLELINK